MFCPICQKIQKGRVGQKREWMERKGPVERERERDWCGFKKFGRVEKKEKG